MFHDYCTNCNIKIDYTKGFPISRCIGFKSNKKLKPTDIKWCSDCENKILNKDKALKALRREFKNLEFTCKEILS